jgi:hypothetical protein
MRRTAALSVAIALAHGGRANADTVEECASASEQGQSLRNQRSWTAAHKQFMSCAHARCPAIVRTDCEQWLGELDRAMPTVIVSAKDPQGSDLVEVRFFVDGALLAERADGKAVSLDPGPHELRYVHAGYAPVVESIVASEAEKNRRLDVRFVAPLEPTRKTPVAGYVLGGAGLLSLGLFMYLDISGQADYDRCAASRSCPPAEIDALETKRYITWSVLGAATALIGVGAFLVFKSRGSATSVRTGAMALPDGAAATLRAEF